MTAATARRAVVFVGVHLAVVAAGIAVVQRWPALRPPGGQPTTVLLLEVLAFAVAVAVVRPGRTPPADPPDLLLRTVCHELRTPLASLEGLTRALAGPSAAGPTRDELALLACHQTRHAQRVLSWVSDLAESSARPGGPVRHRLADVLPAARAAAGLEGRRLRTAVTGSAGEALVDAHVVQRVLTNLLENAARHGAPGGVVHLDAVRAGAVVRLRVRNEGLPTRHLVLALTRREPPVGTQGLGLWVVRELATRAGGDVRLVAGPGVTVEVRLPAATRQPLRTAG